MRTLSWVMCAVAVGASAAGSQSQPPQTNPAAEVATVDVGVVDKDGRPVGDLRPDDFTVAVDGKPRRLVSAEFVSLSARSPGPSGAARTGQVEPSGALSSNEQLGAGRLIVVAVDQGHLQPSSAPGVVAATTRLLDQLGPGDQVALLAFPGDGPSVGFTSDHDRVREALQRVVGRAVPVQAQFSMTVAEAFSSPSARGRLGLSGLWAQVLGRACRGGPTRTDAVSTVDPFCAESLDAAARTIVDNERRATMTTVAALRDLMARFGQIDRPTTVVLVSEGLVLEPDIAATQARSALASLGQAVSQAKLAVYAVQVDLAFLDTIDRSRQQTRILGAEGVDVQLAGLEFLTGAARGAVFKISAPGDFAIKRIALETSAYYSLAFEPEAGDRDGKPHALRVRVEHRDVVVRSRAAFVAGESRAEARAAEDEVEDLLGSPLPASGLPIRVATFTLRDTGTSNVRVMIAADIGSRVTASAELTLGLTIANDSGALFGRYVKKQQLPMAGTGEDACWRYNDAVLLKPGRYTLRFAAVDPSGRGGSIDHHLETRGGTPASAELSDLLLADPSGGELDAAKSAVCWTIGGDTMATHLELYAPQVRTVQQAVVTLEIAGTAGGPSIVAIPASVEARPDEQRWVADQTVDLLLLPPGDYVARAQVTLDGRKIGQATRPFHLAHRVATGAAVPGGRSPRALAAFGEESSLVRSFRRDSVLQPGTVNYFVDRMNAVGGGPVGKVAQSAVELARANQFDQVLRELKTAGSDELAATFLRGLALFANGELEVAANEFRASLRLSSEFLPAAFYLGACYAAGGRDREAAGAWQTALITESDARIVYDVLADAYLRLRDAGQAEAILKEAQTKWPDDELFAPRLAAAYAIAGRDGDALATLARYLDRHSDDDQALFLAMRLIYEAHAGGRTVGTADEDREQIVRYSRLYDAMQGAHREIAARWVAFVQGDKR